MTRGECSTVTEPSVSIAIRAHRREWLDDAIASVLAQTHRDLELVIYNDTGTLESVATRTRDARIRYCRGNANLQASGRLMGGGDALPRAVSRIPR